jgi:hypothetical protein
MKRPDNKRTAPEEAGAAGAELAGRRDGAKSSYSLHDTIVKEELMTKNKTEEALVVKTTRRKALPAPTGLEVAKPALPAQITPESMLLEAIQHGLSTDALERLMAMRREILEEQAKAAFFAALAGFQGECPEIKKTKEVHDKDGMLRYRYAPIDSIVEQTKALRAKWGLSHTLGTDQTATSVAAICTVHHAEGWKEETRFQVPIDEKAYMSAPQKVASALTFAKRYALCNAYGVVTGDEDDDAAGAASYEIVGADDSVVPRGNGERPPSVEELYKRTEETLQKLPVGKSSQLLATALRLRDQGNLSAMKALYESAQRLVAAEVKKGEVK